MASVSLNKRLPVCSNRLRQSAKGKCCTLEIFPVCNHDPDTTVLAHLHDEYSGMGTKASDLAAVYACSSCHDLIDGRTGKIENIDDGVLLRALIKTHDIMLHEGLIQVTGDQNAKGRY